MARIRSIHPNACTSEKLAAIGAEAERCYWRLQTHCDDYGRAEDNVRLIWAALFPLHEEIGPQDVNGWLAELTAVELICRYEEGGKRYLCVTEWERFQHPQRPKPSLIPEPSATHTGRVRDASATGPGHVPPGVGEGEGVGEGDSARKRATRPPKTFAPNDTHRAYAEGHGLSLNDELAGWLDYCEAQGKTYKDHDAGLRTWLRKAVEFGRGAKPAANGFAQPQGVPVPRNDHCLTCGRRLELCEGHDIGERDVTPLFKGAKRG